MSGGSSVHVRAISLVLALGVVVGAWLLLEYSNLPADSSGSPARSSESVEPSATVKPAQEPVDASPDTELQLDRSRNGIDLTFKCQKGGRTTFGDRPCDADAKVVSVTATERLPPVTDNRLQQMKRQVAQMEADHEARERAQVTVLASAATVPSPDKVAQCKEADSWIAHFDSRLRQPHDAHLGDFLTAERKKWMDRRFELRC